MIKENMEWISCEDRMPKVGERVLISPNGAYINIGRLFVRENRHTNSREMMWDVGSFVYMLSEVTHWMPLPEKNHC